MDPRIVFNGSIRKVLPYYFHYVTPFKERWHHRQVSQVLCSELGQLPEIVASAIESGDIYVTTNNGKALPSEKISGAAVKFHRLQPHDIIHNRQHIHEPDVDMGGMSYGNGVYGDATHNDAIYDNAIYGNAIYGNANHGNAINDNTIHGNSTPDNSIHGNANHDNSTPQNSTPQNSSPENSSPQNSSPENSSPQNSSPQNSSPQNSTPQNSILLGQSIIFEDENIVVVNKPAGVPTHPGGIYRYNSMSEIIRIHRGQVWPCHRLDKATSGVLVLAKTKAHCSQYMKQIGQKSSVDKFYLARVKGQFPQNSFQYTFPVFSINSSGGYAQNSVVALDSTTLFRCVQYVANTNESIILCKPISGKMHQIRIHLRNLGFPITNDAYYNGTDEVNSLKSAIEMDIKKSIEAEHPALGIHLISPVLESHQESNNRINNLRNNPMTNPMINPMTNNQMSISNLSTNALSTNVPQNFIQKLNTAIQELQSPSLTTVQGQISISQYIERVIGQIKILADLRAQKDTVPDLKLCDECARPIYNKKVDAGIFLHALILREKKGAFEFFADYPKWVKDAVETLSR